MSPERDAVVLQRYIPVRLLCLPAGLDSPTIDSHKTPRLYLVSEAQGDYEVDLRPSSSAVIACQSVLPKGRPRSTDVCTAASSAFGCGRFAFFCSTPALRTRAGRLPAFCSLLLAALRRWLFCSSCPARRAGVQHAIEHLLQTSRANARADLHYLYNIIARGPVQFFDHFPDTIEQKRRGRDNQRIRRFVRRRWRAGP